MSDHEPRFRPPESEKKPEVKTGLAADLPEEVRNSLIPPKVYEIAQRPDHVEVTISRQVHTATQDFLELFVVEKDVPIPVTDKAQWNEWQEQKKQIRENKSKGIRSLPKASTGINRLHAEYSDLIEHGVFTIDDRVLFKLSLSQDKSAPNTLLVGQYEGEIGAGIATQFYKEVLPKFAREQGYRFVTGSHDERNITFFADKLGGYRGDQIKEEYLNQIFPRLLPQNSGLWSVHFLYEEDKVKYLK